MHYTCICPAPHSVVLFFTFIIVDRFHYKGHGCNEFFDADQYQVLDSIKSSASESINAKIKKSLYHMRYLKGRILVNYLNVRFALLNLTTKYFETFGISDVEDVDLNKFYSNRISCHCQCSLHDRSQQINNESDSDGSSDVASDE